MKLPTISIAERVLEVDWTSYETAYGNATNVADLLITLSSDSTEKAMNASHELWCGLCHQHAYVSSAALPSYPFMMEILKKSDANLAVEILDILLGFALCSHPDFPSKNSEELDWRNELRAELERDLTYFETLLESDNELIVDFAKDIIRYIRSDNLN